MSVIIPMYNAEGYIGDCLDSILAQTFQNFEVIVVDDCSTDSSCSVVESYKERFDGRLTLTRMETNTGSGGSPRNRGLMFSRGEYIFFIDADDLFTKTALKEMHTLAKDFDADVVWTATHYDVDNALKDRGLSPTYFTPNEPMLDIDSLPERIKSISQGKYKVATCTKFVRRDLLVEYKIFFPHCKISEDDIWSFGLLFFAKKILLVPNVVYIRRLSEGSIMRTKRTPQQIMNLWLSPILKGLKDLDEMMSRCAFFKSNPQYRYAVLEMFTNWKFNAVLSASLNIPTFAVYESLKQEYGKNFGDHDVLICALSAVLNSTQKNLLQMRQQLQALANQTQEKQNQFDQFAAQAKARIAQLEAELQKRQP